MTHKGRTNDMLLVRFFSIAPASSLPTFGRSIPHINSISSLAFPVDSNLPLSPKQLSLMSHYHLSSPHSFNITQLANILFSALVDYFDRSVQESSLKKVVCVLLIIFITFSYFSVFLYMPFVMFLPGSLWYLSASFWGYLNYTVCHNTLENFIVLCLLQISLLLCFPVTYIPFPNTFENKTPPDFWYSPSKIHWSMEVCILILHFKEN